MSILVRRIAWNAATHWVATGLNGILGLVLVPFLIGQVGRAGYGLLGVVFVILATAELADLGMRGVIGRQLAEQLARGDKSRFNATASSAVLVAMFAGLFAGSAVFTVAPWLVSWFNIAPGLQHQALFLIRWYGSSTLLISTLIPVISGIITSNNRFDLNNMVAAGANLWRAAAVLLLVGLSGKGLYAWAVAMFSADLVRLGLGWIVARRMLPELRVHPRLISLASIQGIVGLGGFLVGFRVIDLISRQADPLILARVLGTLAVALYSPAIQLLNQLNPFIMTLAEQLHPVATGYHVRDQAGGLRQLLITGTRLTMLIAVPVVVVGVLFAEPIMRLWLARQPEIGADYVVCARVLMIWSVVQFTQYAAGSQWAVLLGMRRVAFLFAISLPLAVVNVISSVLLVKYSGLGVVGVVLPTLVIGVLRRPIVAAYAARSVQLSAWTYFTASYARPLGVLAALAAAAAGLLHWRPVATVLDLATNLLGVGVAWAALCWSIGFGPDDRARVEGLVRSVRRRLSSAAASGETA